MANILALVPAKPGLAPALRERAVALLARLIVAERAIGEHQLEAHIRTCNEVGDGRAYSAHAAARNATLGEYLRPAHTHVLWIDADVVDYPDNLATRLHAIDSEAVIAPLVLIEGTNRFYDTRGFVGLDGGTPRLYPPYGVEGAMLAVGTCYLMPAAPFLAGVRYEPTPEQTEHWSVCRESGLRVRGTEAVTVFHADLPKYGEAWHVWPG